MAENKGVRFTPLQKEVGSLSPDEKDAVFERSTTARMSLPLQVQGQYERTLEESQKLLLERSASDQLARQLSRGLRIRRSGEQRVVRSPSARKIGAVRRRSREASPRHSLVDSVRFRTGIIRKKLFNSVYLLEWFWKLFKTANKKSIDAGHPTESFSGLACFPAAAIASDGYTQEAYGGRLALWWTAATGFNCQSVSPPRQAQHNPDGTKRTYSDESSSFRTTRRPEPWERQQQYVHRFVPALNHFVYNRRVGVTFRPSNIGCGF